jgi:DinB superfamily
MDEAANYAQQISDMSKMLTTVLSGVSDAKLQERPALTLNPTGFICFHLLRVWDYDLNMLIQGRPGEQDAWHRGGIGELAGYEPLGKGGGGRGIGFGYTDAEVDEVAYRTDWLGAYQALLMEETQAYLSTADETELQREFSAGATGVATPTLRLQHTVAHSWNHIGEMRMTKSMIGFPDPTTPPRK